ncbi:hypothetical protein KXD40_009661 [Peronospora effusa]|nr:hypothetical protein KXD40_009661 [Peronospora effusa]
MTVPSSFFHQIITSHFPHLTTSKRPSRTGKYVTEQGGACWGNMGVSGQTGGHAAQVASFQSHVEHKVPTSLVWDDTSCELDLTKMLGSELATIRISCNAL